MEEIFFYLEKLEKEELIKIFMNTSDYKSLPFHELVENLGITYANPPISEFLIFEKENGMEIILKKIEELIIEKSSSKK